jgi:hypothetical protein
VSDYDAIALFLAARFFRPRLRWRAFSSLPMVWRDNPTKRTGCILLPSL